MKTTFKSFGDARRLLFTICMDESLPLWLYSGKLKQWFVSLLGCSFFVWQHFWRQRFGKLESTSSNLTSGFLIWFRLTCCRPTSIRCINVIRIPRSGIRGGCNDYFIVIINLITLATCSVHISECCRYLLLLEITQLALTFSNIDATRMITGPMSSNILGAFEGWQRPGSEAHYLSILRQKVQDCTIKLELMSRHSLFATSFLLPLSNAELMRGRRTSETYPKTSPVSWRSVWRERSPCAPANWLIKVIKILIK